MAVLTEVIHRSAGLQYLKWLMAVGAARLRREITLAVLAVRAVPGLHQFITAFRTDRLHRASVVGFPHPAFTGVILRVRYG